MAHLRISKVLVLALDCSDIEVLSLIHSGLARDEQHTQQLCAIRRQKTAQHGTALRLGST